MNVTSGYKTITPIQLANVLCALNQRLIDRRGLRVYLACFVMLAVREAAARSRTRQRKQPKGTNRYRVRELERITGLDAAKVKRALRELDRQGLVVFSVNEVVITTETLPGSESLQEALACRRSPRRPIPVPRSILRFIARTRSEALLKTIIAYLVRGLAIDRKGGDIRAKGTVKASWIGEAFELSHRAVKYAQAQLRGLHWISKDTQSVQRKLNRDGAYFVINLDWCWQSGNTSEGATQEKGHIVNSDKIHTSFALPPTQNTTVFAPPIENRKTSNEFKNQNAQIPEPERPGVFKPKGEEKINLPAPELKHVRREDLHKFSRLESLYFEALDRGWLDRSEATALNFIAAAVKAREEGDDPARLFISIMRRGLWHHINHGHEECARVALKRFRQEDPDRFRASAAEVQKKVGPT